MYRITDEDKIVLRTMHDLACRQLAPLLAQAGSEGGAKIGAQLTAMQELVARLTGLEEAPETEVVDGNSVEYPRT